MARCPECGWPVQHEGSLCSMCRAVFMERGCPDCGADTAGRCEECREAVARDVAALNGSLKEE